ncbi:3300_t:CDS:2 [Ambispora gerdemannii]|uniref:3300_t:CDS:1 n=1 Tax=Ambispora gerdemannii TaxID=144530 RepID=A0A9N9BPL8_9GLOM|nr:3300_t:CDS:2 [Ambispora gerdemannii]
MYKNKITELKSEIDQLKKKLTTYEAYKKDLDSIEGILIDLRDENKKLDFQTIVNYKVSPAKLNEAQQKIKDLRVSLGIGKEFEGIDLQDDIEDIKKKDDANNQKISRLESKRDKLEKDINDLDKKIRKLEENEEDNEDEIRRLKREKNGLEEDLKIKEKDLKTAREEKKRLSDELAALKAQQPATPNLPSVPFNEDEKRKLEKFLEDYKSMKNLWYKDIISTNSEEYKKLLAEIEDLRKQLASTNQEIDKIRRKNDNLKEQLNANYQTLQAEIEEKSEVLEKAKINFLEKIEDNRNSSVKKAFSDILKDKNNKYYTEKLESLLKFQEEITRGGSDFLTDQKKKIIAEIPKKFSEESKSLCILQEELTKLEMKKKDIEKAGQVLKTVMIAPVIPPQLRNKESSLEDRSDIEKGIKYDKIHSESRKFHLQKNHKIEEFPTRLYSIQENRVVEAKNNANINNYAILSYVWGEAGDLPAEERNELDNGDNEDKNKEVPKMRQYYFNSTVTLIAIHTSLGSEEVAQGEGWLSKQTLFMFDNALIDGNGYDEEDRISFTLNQALRAIKNRGRGVSIDGIYSILGLLPYGDKVPQKDLEKALFDVMFTAMKEGGYNEYFAWHGLGGGTSIEGGINIVRRHDEELDLEKEEKDKGSVIDSGACTRSITVSSNDNQEEIEITLLSTSEILKKRIKLGDILLLLSKEE